MISQRLGELSLTDSERNLLGGRVGLEIVENLCRQVGLDGQGILQ